MKYLFATNNPGKIREIKVMFEKAGLEMLSLADLGLSFEPTETGTTFEENAIQKAVKTAEFLQEKGFDKHNDPIAVLSDDSGLCIDPLSGMPGVDSANFMGRETPYDVRNSRIIDMLSELPKTQRIARFMCVTACVWPDWRIQTASGKIVGVITNEPRGDGGFGYDPIFFVPEFGKTMAELTQEQKNSISHRGEALRGMIELLKQSREV